MLSGEHTASRSCNSTTSQSWGEYLPAGSDCSVIVCMILHLHMSHNKILHNFQAEYNFFILFVIWIKALKWCVTYRLQCKIACANRNMCGRSSWTSVAPVTTVPDSDVLGSTSSMSDTCTLAITASNRNKCHSGGKLSLQTGEPNNSNTTFHKYLLVKLYLDRYENTVLFILPFLTSGVSAMMQFLAVVASYFKVLTESDTAFSSFSVYCVYMPCLTRQSFNQRLKVLCAALGPQTRECRSSGPAGMFSPAESRSM